MTHPLIELPSIPSDVCALLALLGNTYAMLGSFLFPGVAFPRVTLSRTSYTKTEER